MIIVWITGFIDIWKGIVELFEIIWIIEFIGIDKRIAKFTAIIRIAGFIRGDILIVSNRRNFWICEGITRLLIIN